MRQRDCGTCQAAQQKIKVIFYFSHWGYSFPGLKPAQFNKRQNQLLELRPAQVDELIQEQEKGHDYVIHMAGFGGKKRE